MAKTTKMNTTVQSQIKTETTGNTGNKRNVIIAALVIIIMLLGFGFTAKVAYNQGVEHGKGMAPACSTELVDIQEVEPTTTPEPTPTPAPKKSVVVVDTATKHEHVFEMVDFRAPDYSQDGYEIYQCSCGEGWTNALAKLVAEPTPKPEATPEPTPTPAPACRVELQPVEKQVEKVVEKEIVVEVPTTVQKEVEVEVTYYEYDVVNSDGSFTHVACTTQVPPSHATNVAFLNIVETQIVEETVMVQETQTVFETVVETVIEYVEVEICQ